MHNTVRPPENKGITNGDKLLDQHEFPNIKIILSNNNEDPYTERMYSNFNKCSCNCDCTKLRIYQTKNKSYNKYVSINPMYSYHPVRHKYYISTRQCFSEVFQFVIAKKLNVATSRLILFMLLLLSNFPLNVLSHVSPITTPGKCFNYKTTYRDVVSKVTTKHSLRESVDCTQSYSDSESFCRNLPKCVFKATTNNRNMGTTLPYSEETELNNNNCGSLISKSVHYELFCDQLPVSMLLNISMQNGNLYEECPSEISGGNCQYEKCIQDIQRIKENDQKALLQFNTFFDTIKKYATPDFYSISGYKHQCLLNYKAWICGEMHQTLYETGRNCTRELIKPCSTHCIDTELSCPFFRVFKETKLAGGQPVFICNGFKVGNNKLDPQNCLTTLLKYVHLSTEYLMEENKKFSNDSKLDFSQQNITSQNSFATKPTFIYFFIFSYSLLLFLDKFFLSLFI